LGHLLCWGVVLLDRAIDENGDIVGGSLDGSWIFADGQLSHQLVEHLDAVLVFGHLGVGWRSGRIGDCGHVENRRRGRFWKCVR
jgi:hypothetical protein